MNNKSRVIIFLIVSALTVSGCGVNFINQAKEIKINSENSEYNILPSSPITKPDGTKFRVSYVDEDPYPITAEMFYYVVESLKEDGWITYDKLPFNPENCDAMEIIKWLSERDVGPYMEFAADASYYLKSGEDYFDDYVATRLKEHVLVKKDVDLIFASGTRSSMLCKKLELPVPLMMYACVNPVGSGLVKSEANSGNEMLWAHIGKTDYEKQLSYYYNIFEFKNVGIVFYDETVAPMNAYRKVAANKGFRLSEAEIPPLEDQDIEFYYNDIKNAIKKLVEEENIDAFILTTNLIRDEKRTREFFDLLYENKVPTLVQYGAGFVENGALLLVQPLDYKGVAPFCSYVMGAIFNGAKPVELPQEFVSSPYLVINLDTANKIGYKPTFDMLLSSEKIYTKTKETDQVKNNE